MLGNFWENLKKARAKVKQDAAEENAWYNEWQKWDARQKAAYAQHNAAYNYQQANYQQVYQQFHQQSQAELFNLLNQLRAQQVYEPYQPPPTPQQIERARIAKTWRIALGFGPNQQVSVKEVTDAWRELVKKAHPDHGGDEDEMKALNLARECAMRELSPSA